MRHPRAVQFAVCAITALLVATPASAQTWLFEGRRYQEPLIAGVREPHVSALGLASASRMAFQVQGDDPRRVWDIDLGVELPIVGWESRRSVNGRVPQGAFGIGFWFPIDFHMIEDFVDDSAPIINTDYRFGGMIKLQYGLGAERWLGLRMFVGHESTHLGDEFSIVGQRTYPMTFERINVSWEFLDLTALYEAVRESMFYSVRGGVTYSLKDSYYQTDAASITQSPIGPVTPSKSRIDPYLGIEAEWEEMIRLGTGWGPHASVEIRWRSIYDYHRASADMREERQASFNIIAGIRQTGTGGALGRASPFLRYYHGVNPHGQFRNQRDFRVYGVGLRLSR
jgi:hypothetical protein